MLFAYLVLGLALCLAYALGVRRLHTSLVARAVARATAELEQRLAVNRAVLACAAEAARDQEARLADAERARAEPLAALARAIRPAATHLAGFAQWLGGDAEPAGVRRQQAAAGMAAASARLLAVADEAAVLAAVPGEGPPLEIQRLDLRLALRFACDGLAAEAWRAGVLLDCPPAEAGLGVYADPMPLRQILRRLLADAIRNTPAGGVVRLELRQAGTRRELRIHDAGRSPAAVLDALFEPFAAAEPVPGAAPGLAAAQRLAEAMHGALAAAASSDGVVFTLSLPAARPVRSSGPGRVALQISDDAASAILVRLAADAAGVGVHGATSVEAGLELARVLNPDLILLDLDMAGGEHVVRALAADPATRDAPVVVLGGGRGAGRRRLEKPLDPEALKAALLGEPPLAADFERAGPAPFETAIPAVALDAAGAAGA